MSNYYTRNDENPDRKPLNRFFTAYIIAILCIIWLNHFYRNIPKYVIGTLIRLTFCLIAMTQWSSV